MGFENMKEHGEEERRDRSRNEGEDESALADAQGFAEPSPDNIKRETSSKHEVYEWVECVVAALIFSMLVFLFIGRVIRVEGASMNPTLNDGQKVIMSGLFYTPAQGDIIILTPPGYDDGNTPLVKRIIALEGQTVDIDFEKGSVFVDGVLLEEDYVNAPTHLAEDFEGSVTVPEGCVFVMGDNRNASTDSRDLRIGMVDERSILGKVYFIVFPFSDFARVF